MSSKYKLIPEIGRSISYGTTRSGIYNKIIKSSINEEGFQGQKMINKNEFSDNKTMVLDNSFRSSHNKRLLK